VRLSFLLICLVKLLRGIKTQMEIEAFPFAERRDCISVSAGTRERKQEDMFYLFEEGGWKKSEIL